jgi:hypothetical protein
MLWKKSPARPGWALVEILCCTVIVTIVVTCVAQATDMMLGIALKNRDMRANTADYLSLSDEVSVHAALTNDSEFARGKWRGRKINSGFLSGIAFADVAIGNESAGGDETIERLWNIAGRE